MGSFSRWASFIFKAPELIGSFSIWASFRFKGHEWAPFRDGLLFLLMPMNGLLFEMGFFYF